ncbi:MAG: molybdopterin molybdotransferase MoeA [Hyphomonadaceae bacterium]|nr:molybdopterin molybdotransferase MoeA [Hyphomonadaceae bacterium]
MTSVAEARALMLGAIETVGSEIVPLAQARRRTLAAPVIAKRAQPPFAASAMDGYALRAADTPGTLRIVGESAAGHAFKRALQTGEAVRISTGAPLPEGADAVLIQEDARVEGDRLQAGQVLAGRHVRAAGIDFPASAAVLTTGRRLDPIAMALTAASGAANVDVWRRPRITVLCGGDEIVAPDASPRSDQIFESCSYAIAAFAEEWGARAFRPGPLPDDPDAIECAASDALRSSDLVVFVGSASFGPHDHAKSSFERCGAKLLVRKIDMRPGKPTWFATSPHAPVLGLPGNPASAIVAAMLFLRPVVERMLGRSGEISLSHARLAAALPANGEREAYLRARTWEVNGEMWIEACADQDSSLLSVFASANALLVRPAEAGTLDVGALVEFLLLQG